ncbi:MAG: 5'-3' exonuclease H3TH domain-containing protein [bacterium]|nr:5'-3' exonuclease H3TH domain-containing protein [bacterium]
MKCFILIDGNAILHRAYHALPPLTDRSGNLINAAYGFSTMLLRVIDDLKPDYLAVAFDRSEPTFRHMEYLGYQSQRPEMAEDLSGQIEKVHEIVEAFGIPIYSLSGFEADDVIGTLASQATKGLAASRSPLEVIIVTGDRDIMQLVNENIKVYAPVRGMSETEMFDPEKVTEKMGVKPSQIVDYKGLVGDPSDNYPGVLGIGPKTASDLLKKYQTLENIYQHLDELSETVAKKLAEGKDLALLSQKLARIVTNAPVDLDIEKCRFDFTSEEKKNVAEKFSELGFKSLSGRLIGNPKTEKPKNSKIRNEGQGGLF